MQLYSSETNAPWNAGIICRQSRIACFIVGSVYAALLGLLPAVLWYTEGLPKGLAVGIGLISVFIQLVVIRRFLATLRRSNWTLAVGPDGLWLNLRSYQNFQLDPGETVVHFSYRDISSVSEHLEWRSTETSGGTASWKELSLDVHLNVPNIEAIRTAIAEERVRRTARKLLGGMVTVSGRANHVPVTLRTDGTLRIMWKSRYDFVRPSLTRVMDVLSLYVDVRQDPSLSEQKPRWEKLTDEQLDAEILRSVEAGDSLSAVKLLTSQRGYTVTEAKLFVDQLANVEHASLP